MIKYLFISALSLLFLQDVKAQKQDTSIYFVKNSGQVVRDMNQADYFITVLPPDDLDRNLYIVNEFYLSGKIKLRTKSTVNSLPLHFEGPCLWYFENGHKKLLQTYKDGEPVGDMIWYYPDGNLYTIASVVPNNKKKYLKECRDSTGKVLCENGNGEWLAFDEDFKNMEQGPVVNGRRNGEWKGTWEDSIKYTCIYKKDEITSGIGYDKDGKAFPFKKVTIQPKFNNGIETPIQFVDRNKRYPEYAKKHNITGEVIVGFTVEKDGTVTNIRIVSGQAPSLNEEALRVVKLFPQWIPGKQFGMPVQWRFKIPVSFGLVNY